jgi:hypothetical protein
MTQPVDRAQISGPCRGRGPHQAALELAMMSTRRRTPSSHSPVVMEWEHCDHDNPPIIVHRSDCTLCSNWAEHYSADYHGGDQSLLDAIEHRDMYALDLDEEAEGLRDTVEFLEDNFRRAQQEIEDIRLENGVLTAENDYLRAQLALAIQFDLPPPRMHPQHAPPQAPSPQDYIVISSTEASPPPTGPLAGPSSVVGVPDTLTQE